MENNTIEVWRHSCLRSWSCALFPREWEWVEISNFEKLYIFHRHSFRLRNCSLLKINIEPYILTGPLILRLLVREPRGYEPWQLHKFVLLLSYSSQVMLWHIVSWNLFVVLSSLRIKLHFLWNMNSHIMSVFGFNRTAAGRFYKPLRDFKLWHGSSCPATRSSEAFKSKQWSCGWITLKN